MARNPLTKDSREKMAAIGRNLRELVGIIKKCRACNLDVDEVEKAAIYLYDQLGLIEREFGSGQQLPDVHTVSGASG